MSASPAGSNADEGDHDKKITFRFCSECSNLLYPKEDKEGSRLLFACRTCQYNTPAINPMVTRKEVSSSAGDTAGLTQDIGQDPTVSDPDSDDALSDGDSTPGFCTMCGGEILCEICGEEYVDGLCLEVNHNPTTSDGPYMDVNTPQTPESLADEDMDPIHYTPLDGNFENHFEDPSSITTTT